MDNKNIYKLIVIFVLFLVITTPYMLNRGASEKISDNSIGDTDALDVFNLQENIDPFAGLSLQARAIYVFDVASGKSLYSKNENEVLPLASLAKIMTAIVATDIVPESTVVKISSDDIRKEGDSGLLVGERWRMSDIIDFTLTTSSNDGASAIASVAGSIGDVEYTSLSKEAKSEFINKMNLKADNIGLYNTRFFNESGLDIISNTSGSYGTAKDVALLMAYAVKNKSDVIGATSLQHFVTNTLNNNYHIAINTNTSTDKIPGLIASKTGFTDLAGGNLVVVFDAGIMRPIVVSVLGSTIDGRFEDVEKLVQASLKAI